MNFLKKNFVLIILLFLNLITHYVWVFNFDYLTFGDSRVYVPETQLELIKNSSQIYNSNANLGTVELSGGTKLIEFIHGISAYFGLNYNISFRLIYLYPFTFLAPFIIYFFFKKFLKTEVAVLIASIVYLFNTYTLILQTAGVLMLLGNLFLILNLLFYYKFFYEKKNASNFLMIILSGFILSTYEFRIFYINCAVTSLFLLHYFFFTKKDYKIFIYHIVFIVSVFILNFHWIFPLINLGKLTDNELFSRNVFGSSYFDISASFTLFHRFWTSEKPSFFINQNIPFYFWIIPILCVLGAYYSRKNKFIVFFLGIYLIGVFLTKQEGIPFKDIYEWLYKNFPGFNAFREASKFYVLVAIGTSALIGYFIDEFKTKNKYTSYVIYALISILFISNARNLITGKIDTLFIPRSYPQKYREFNNFIIEQNKEFRVLLVPANSKWGFYSNQNPILSNAELDRKYPEIKNLPEFNEYTKPKNSNINFLRQSFSNNIIDRLSIKYLVVPISVADEDMFVDYGKNREHYLDILKNSSYLKTIKLNEGDLAVFENSEYRPRIYLTTEKQTIYKDYPYEKVEYMQINPTTYQVEIKNLNKPVILNFSENFSPDWNLYYGEYNSKNILYNKIEKIPSIKHEKDDLGLNIFYIDPKELINQNNKIYLNENGSINIKFFIYFKTQTFFYYGLGIVALSIIIITVTSLILFKRNDKF